MAITVHLERGGKPFSMLLDLVEVAMSHTGMNLGATFMTVLKQFGVEGKVRASNSHQKRSLTHDVCYRYLALLVITHLTMIR